MTDDLAADSQERESASAGPSMTAAELARIFGEVRTERLSLRRLHEADAPAMFRVHGDPETNRFNPFGPDRDLAASEERLRSWLHAWQEDGFGYWAVALPPASEIVGFGGVRRMSVRGSEVANLYYRLIPAVWGRGYATELTQKAVSLARAHLPQLPVMARVRPINLASMRTAERAGLPRRPELDTAEYAVFALGWPSPT